MRYTANFNIRSYEVDLNGALKPMQLMQLLQEATDHQMRDEDVDYDSLYIKERKAFVVSRMNIEIFEPVYKYSDVEVQTWVVEGRAANFPRGYEMLKDGRVTARAMSNWALLDLDTGKLVLNDGYDMSHYSMDAQPKLDIPSRFRRPKDLEFKRVESTYVTRSMIDINKHMNNTVYASKLYDNIPNAEEFFITSINLRYINEAPFNSDFVVYAGEPVKPDGMDPRADELIYFYTETGGNINIEAAIGLKKI